MTKPVYKIHIGKWVSPTGWEDPESAWGLESNAYDEDLSTAAIEYAVPAQSWSEYLILTHATLTSDALRFAALYDAGGINTIDVDVLKDGAWVDVYQGSFADATWEEKTFTAGSVTKTRMRFYNSNVSVAKDAKVYEFDFASTYVITQDAISTYFKEVVTDGVGTFMVALPTKKNGDSYYYNDVAINDIVKIWLGYDSVSGDPNFIGKVQKISAPLRTETGYLRYISGLSQGEILLKRLKRWRTWDSVGASTIVTELADDLGLGTGDIESDSTKVSMHVESARYFDVLRAVSDYWYDAGTQIKKDFYVDVDNDLVWKSRPLRTVGVETFTVGHNITSYNVVRDVDSVKNKIYFYGVGQKPQPEWRDDWTETLNRWTADPDTPSLSSDKDEGDYSVKIPGRGFGSYETEAQARLTCTATIDWTEVTGQTRTFTYAYKLYTSETPDYREIRAYLLAPDTSNMFFYSNGSPVQNAWTTLNLSKANFNVYSGSPSWEKITAIRFWGYVQKAASPVLMDLYIDDVRFTDGRAQALVEDASSQTTYGIREVQYTDLTLLTNTECNRRGETVLYQLKDPPTQIEVTVPGNTNVLVGDRIPMTIPAENISSVNYDVITVEQSLSNNGFVTRAVMVDSENVREPIITNQMSMMVRMQRELQKLSREKLVVE